MLRLILGTVTLAAAGYAVKEYCETERCPWELWESEEDSKEPMYQDTLKESSYEIAKQFYKQKKVLYKSAMSEYETFLQTHSLEIDSVEFDQKLQKQKFEDEIVTDEVQSYMDKILLNMEILSANLTVVIKTFNSNELPVADAQTKIKTYIKAIYDLAHLQLFSDSFTRHEVQKNEILETLVGVMDLSIKKEVIHVDLNGEFKVQK